MTGIERSSARWRSRLTASSRATLAEMSPVCSTVIRGCAAPTASTERRSSSRWTNCWTVPTRRTACRSGETRVSTLPPTADASRADAAAVAARNAGSSARSVCCGGTRTRASAARRGSAPSASSRAPTRRRRRSAAPPSRPRPRPPRRARRTRATPRSPTTGGGCSSGRPRPRTSSAECASGRAGGQTGRPAGRVQGLTPDTARWAARVSRVRQALADALAAAESVREEHRLAAVRHQTPDSRPARKRKNPGGHGIFLFLSGARRRYAP